MSEGRLLEACPKLVESHRLDPSGGTILNLALCHEQQGMLARAWSEFQEAISFARRDVRPDREQAAASYVRALEPRLSTLTIVVPAVARLPGLRVLRDGSELGEASWEIAMPVDGGEHSVRAVAPGQQPFAATVIIAKESDSRTVEVPPFVAAPAAPLPALGSPTGAPSEGTRAAGPSRALAWTIGAAGLVQWGAAGYFGVRAFQKHGDSNSACPNEQCTPRGVEAERQAGRAADTATALTITGFVSVAASVYLLLSSRASDSAQPTRAPSRYALGSAGRTLALQGRF
ncbi:MAG: hypothetical protein ABW217_09930 [Polyangiaceae bacterium]